MDNNASSSTPSISSGVADNSPNPFGILIQFSNLIEANFPSFMKVQTATNQESLYAEKLYESFLSILQEFVEEEDDELILSESTDSKPMEDTSSSEDDSEYEDQIPVSDKGDIDYVQLSPSKKKKQDPVEISKERKEEIIALWDNHPAWKWSTLKTHGAKEIPDSSTLYRWRGQVRRGKSLREKYHMIKNHVFHQLTEAIKFHKILRASHLRYWAMQKFLEINDPSIKFKASKSWADRFKSTHRISHRKITQLVSKREIKSEQEILDSAKKFQAEIRKISQKFDADHIFNTDQCGFQYEITSARTYTFKGEKNVFG
ncbi:Tigger transposable element-derived protein 6 [Folsomia candida]|uniref:Tigger transposable element-derived protein 6 n=1 Tax=Folsomia candida TaxID=158441 RepID=A0A226DNW8_FOLCA|nr:Tigger transposable element-derived protein 6 [Folsomia candida]